MCCPRCIYWEASSEGDDDKYYWNEQLILYYGCSFLPNWALLCFLICWLYFCMILWSFGFILWYFWERVSLVWFCTMNIMILFLVLDQTWNHVRFWKWWKVQSHSCLQEYVHGTQIKESRDWFKIFYWVMSKKNFLACVVVTWIVSNKEAKKPSHKLI